MPRRNVTPVARFLKVPVNTGPEGSFMLAVLTLKIKFSIERNKKQTSPKTVVINIRKCKLISGKK